MKISDSIRKSIDDWEANELEASMLHACNAVDGTDSKFYDTQGSNARFTRLLRDYYYILGPMGMPGIDLVNVRWPVNVPNPKANDGRPDIADLIYGIHRCRHGHGEALPDGFELIRDASSPDRITHVYVEAGKVRISDRMIFALLAVAVMCPANRDQSVPDGYFLAFGHLKLPINEWWGRASDFPAVAAQDLVPQVTLDFADWMNV